MTSNSESSDSLPSFRRRLPPIENKRKHLTPVNPSNLQAGTSSFSSNVPSSGRRQRPDSERMLGHAEVMSKNNCSEIKLGASQRAGDSLREDYELTNRGDDRGPSSNDLSFSKKKTMQSKKASMMATTFNASTLDVARGRQPGQFSNTNVTDYRSLGTHQNYGGAPRDQDATQRTTLMTAAGTAPPSDRQNKDQDRAFVNKIRSDYNKKLKVSKTVELGSPEKQREQPERRDSIIDVIRQVSRKMSSFISKDVLPSEEDQARHKSTFKQPTQEDHESEEDDSESSVSSSLKSKQSPPGKPELPTINRTKSYSKKSVVFSQHDSLCSPLENKQSESSMSRENDTKDLSAGTPSPLHIEEEQDLLDTLLGTLQSRKSLQELSESGVLKIKSISNKGIIPHSGTFAKYWSFSMATVMLLGCLIIPLEIAFEYHFLFGRYSLAVVSSLVNLFNLVDFSLKFKTSFRCPQSGDEVTDPQQIIENYICSIQFWVDLASLVPILFIFKVLGDKEPVIQMLSLMKFFNIDLMRWISNLNEMTKLKLSLVSLLFTLLLYVHVSGCLLYYVASWDRQWIPIIYEPFQHKLDFYESSFKNQYLISIYSSIMIVTGNEISPLTHSQILMVAVLSIIGALFIANIFGTFAVVVSALNRKQQRFQDKIDVANTSMFNMKLPASLQEEIRAFMTQTSSNLDNQKELDTFMLMISPSLRTKVTKYIFINAIQKNPIFRECLSMIDYLIRDVSTLLFLPEDDIIYQGQTGDSLFLIAKGQCTVWVNDHKNKQRFVRLLDQAEYFGELALINQSTRTATVKSQNYCTLACLNKTVIFDLLQNFPDILIKMKQHSLTYKDPWKKFKVFVLNQIDYFRDAKNPEMIEDIQAQMEEEVYDKGSVIISTGEVSKEIFFIVQGQVELTVDDSQGNSMVLEVLKPGELMGAYSVLFNEKVYFTAKAKTKLKLLVLSQDFFMKNKEIVNGLEDAVLAAEENVNNFGVPLCDFQKLSPQCESFRDKARRALRRAKVVSFIFRGSTSSSPKQSLKATPQTSFNQKSHRRMSPTKKSVSSAQIIENRLGDKTGKKEADSSAKTPVDILFSNAIAPQQRRMSIFTPMIKVNSFGKSPLGNTGNKDQFSKDDLIMKLVSRISKLEKRSTKQVKMIKSISQKSMEALEYESSSSLDSKEDSSNNYLKVTRKKSSVKTVQKKGSSAFAGHSDDKKFIQVAIEEKSDEGDSEDISCSVDDTPSGMLSFYGTSFRQLRQAPSEQSPFTGNINKNSRSFSKAYTRFLSKRHLYQ